MHLHEIILKLSHVLKVLFTTVYRVYILRPVEGEQLGWKLHPVQDPSNHWGAGKSSVEYYVLAVEFRMKFYFKGKLRVYECQF